jgi:hypothetical protein
MRRQSVVGVVQNAVETGEYPVPEKLRHELIGKVLTVDKWLSKDYHILRKNCIHYAVHVYNYFTNAAFTLEDNVNFMKQGGKRKTRVTLPEWTSSSKSAKP